MRTPHRIGARARKRGSLGVRKSHYLERAWDAFVGCNINPRLANSGLRRALANVQRVLMIDPKNYDALILLGHVELELDRAGDGAVQAEECYRKAISLDPSNPEAYWAQATLFQETGELRQAERLARYSIRLLLRESDPDPSDLETGYLTLTDILIQLGRCSAARRTLRQALRRVPTPFMHSMVRSTLAKIGSRRTTPRQIPRNN